MSFSITAIIPTMLNDSGLFYLVQKLISEKIPIIIIDNQPNSKKHKLAKNKQITYLPQTKNLGFAAAVNLGVKAATTDWLLILNDDIELSKSSLHEWPSGLSWSENFKQLLAALISYAQINKLVAVSPVLANKQDKVENYGYRVLPYGKVELNLYAKDANIDGLTAACLLIRRDIFLKVGGFDKRFFAYLEDVDIFLTLKKQNYKFAIYPKLAVIHSHLSTSSKMHKGFKQKQDFKNWILLSTKHPRYFKFKIQYFLERLRNLNSLIKNNI